VNVNVNLSRNTKFLSVVLETLRGVERPKRVILELESQVIRRTEKTDAQAILSIVAESGQFDADGLAHVQDTLRRHLDGHGEGIWLTSDDGEAVGVAYCAPEPVASGTWNLLMLWIRTDRHRKGNGALLVKQVERELRDRGARLLIVETSGLAAFEPARSFYAKCGFALEASIKNFFAAGDDKLVFTKSLVKGSQVR
jgi:GNAT superfamily N-acetyltransferase